MQIIKKYLSSYSTRIDFAERIITEVKKHCRKSIWEWFVAGKEDCHFFYNVFSGSIVDVSILKNLLKYLEEYRLKEITLIMDGGFFSTSNVLSLMESLVRINILRPLSFSLKKTKESISHHSKALKSSKTAFKYNEEIMHHLTTAVSIGNHDFTAHIFFNEKMKLEDRQHFLSNLLDIESQYKERKFDSKKEAQTFIDSEIPEKLRAFFCRDNTSKLIVKNDYKIKGYISKLGYFIIITNDQSIDKHIVLCYYRDKDKVEKYSIQ